MISFEGLRMLIIFVLTLVHIMKQQCCYPVWHVRITHLERIVQLFIQNKAASMVFHVWGGLGGGDLLEV